MNKSILKCLKTEFKIEKTGDNQIRVLTPFLYNDNDHIELFISTKKDYLYICDLGLTTEKFFKINQDLLFKLSKNIDTGFSFEEETLFFYKEIREINNPCFLLREIISFSNNLQRLETLYLYLINNKLK